MTETKPDIVNLEQLREAAAMAAAATATVAHVLGIQATSVALQPNIAARMTNSGLECTAYSDLEGQALGVCELDPLTEDERQDRRLSRRYAVALLAGGRAPTRLQDANTPVSPEHRTRADRSLAINLIRNTLQDGEDFETALNRCEHAAVGFVKKNLVTIQEIARALLRANQLDGIDLAGLLAPRTFAEKQA